MSVVGMAQAPQEFAKPTGEPVSPKIGRYFVQRLLGEGGMGKVYEAYDPHLGRKVAIKVVRHQAEAAVEAPTLQESTTLLLQEARNLAKLSHPNIVPIYDVGLSDEQSVYLAMEFVPGQTLRALLESKRYQWQELLLRLLDACEGLAVAHDHELLHRDIKPENMMVGDDLRIRILDFGLAQASAKASEKAPTPEQRDANDANFQRSGTPAYMAPEQLTGAPLHPSTDLFAFCVIFYEAIAGTRPFPTSPASRRLYAIQHAHLTWPHRVPRWLRKEIARGLEFSPELRHQSLQDFVSAIRRGLEADRRKRSTALTTLALSGIVAAFSWLVPPEQAPIIDILCQQPTQLLDRSWTSKNRHTMELGFLVTDVSQAQDLWQRSEKSVEDYYAQWKKSVAVICANEADTSSLPPDVRQAARWCLSECSAEFAALAQVWQHPTARQVSNAPRAVATLTSPETCVDPAQLRSRAALPSDVDAREQLLRIKKDLQAINVHVRQADYDHAGKSLAQLRPEVVQTRHLATISDFYSILGGIAVIRSELTSQSSIPLYRSLLWGAAADRPANSSHAASVLWFTRAYVARHEEESDELLGLEKSYADRGQPNRLLYAPLERNLGIVQSSKGRFKEAMVHFYRGLNHRIAATGANSYEVARSYEDIGVTAFHAGDYQEAVAQFGRSLEIENRINGPTHRRTMQVAANYHSALEAVGNPHGAILAVLASWQACATASTKEDQCKLLESSYAGLQASLGHYDVAQPTLAAEVETEKQRGHREVSAQASAQSALATLLRQRGEHVIARELAKRSLAQIDAETDPAPSAELEAIVEAFWTSLDAKELASAQHLLERIEKIENDTHVKASELSSALPRARAALAMARHRWLAALEALDQAQYYAQTEHEPPQNSISLLFELAQCYAEVGELPHAAELAAQSLQLANTIEGLADHRQVAATWLLATIAQRQGRFLAALAYVEAARQLQDPAETLDDYEEELQRVQAAAINAAKMCW